MNARPHYQPRNKSDGNMTLREPREETEVDRVTTDMRRRITKLEGKMWDGDREAAMSCVLAIEEQTQALRLAVAEHFGDGE